MRAAFLAWLAPDAIALPRRAGERPGDRSPRRPEPPIVLDWRPVFVEVAASGELGLSTGPWTITSRTDPAAPPAPRPVRLRLEARARRAVAGPRRPRHLASRAPALARMRPSRRGRRRLAGAATPATDRAGRRRASRGSPPRRATPSAYAGIASSVASACTARAIAPFLGRAAALASPAAGSGAHGVDPRVARDQPRPGTSAMRRAATAPPGGPDGGALRARVAARARRLADRRRRRERAGAALGACRGCRGKSRRACPWAASRRASARNPTPARRPAASSRRLPRSEARHEVRPRAGASERHAHALRPRATRARRRRPRRDPASPSRSGWFASQIASTGQAERTSRTLGWKREPQPRLPGLGHARERLEVEARRIRRHERFVPRPLEPRHVGEPGQARRVGDRPRGTPGKPAP